MCNGLTKRGCKKCYNEYMRAYMANRYIKRRKQIIEKLGGVCVECGTTENLEIDHIERSMKSFGIGKAIAGWSWKRLNQELDKCQLLCKTHHQDKTVSESSVEHGGGLSGKKSCYCSLCGPLKVKYQNKQRQRKKSCKCGKLIDVRSTTCRSCNMKQLNTSKLP